MGLLHYLWSRTAASNSTADAQINWQEGQAPSSVNDSARAMMASLAGYRDDISGAIVTTGTSTAYVVASYQVFDSLAHMDKMVIAFTPHTTNGDAATLNVDGLGAKQLRSQFGVNITAGVLVQGTPYVALFDNANNQWLLQNFYGNPYNIPIGAGMDYWAGATPNSSFAFAFGQAISRTTYATLYALIGGQYGSGDGSTTFNLPDVRGRVVAAIDNLGGSTANRLVSGSMAASRHTLGGAGGADTNTLTSAQIPAHTHANTLSDPGHTHGYLSGTPGAQKPNSGGTAPFDNTNTSSTTSAATTGITINNASAGSGAAHDNLQPMILASYIMRII